ncbi:hypothetical protein CERSUDRAFT_127775 [Gelatoporia subvermispora B]|uniref:Uncharacterized protein n=1 Tax=Ceriporiopsis subvermispora (strain B) TaxID=914234 RepID=M2QF12_CERS8|nr:hypothetical protein CERSUDRAFT_127775 [Gelatoporia subvermispora B]
MTRAHGGGRQLDAFVEKHFNKDGPRNEKTKRYMMLCKYCTDPKPIEHRDRRCILHVSKFEHCPNAPQDVRIEALSLLVANGGLEVGPAAPALGTKRKPIVDAIGNLESRDASLADCMLELIWAERAIARLPITATDDADFAAHAKSSLHREFHRMNTSLHWLALFLHPLCRRLAISSATQAFTTPDDPALGNRSQDESLKGPEDISLDEIEAEFSWMEAIAHEQASSPVEGDSLSGDISVEDTYAVKEMETIRKGLAPCSLQDEVAQLDDGTAAEGWDARSLLRDLGIN